MNFPALDAVALAGAGEFPGDVVGVLAVVVAPLLDRSRRERRFSGGDWRRSEEEGGS